MRGMGMGFIEADQCDIDVLETGVHPRVDESGHRAARGDHPRKIHALKTGPHSVVFIGRPGEAFHVSDFRR
jgi:hypothetical protein